MRELLKETNNVAILALIDPVVNCNVYILALIVVVGHRILNLNRLIGFNTIRLIESNRNDGTGLHHQDYN